MLRKKKREKKIDKWSKRERATTRTAYARLDEE